jgi:DNA-binding NarL/FixJ family response regulator
MKVLMVVEDDVDMRELIAVLLADEPRFEVEGSADTAEEAIELARTLQPGLVILDHQLEGELTGLEAAPVIKAAAPNAKILLFTAHNYLRVPAKDSQDVDGFLPKTELKKLVPVCRELVGLA